MLSGATLIAASACTLSAWADVVCRGQVVDEQGEPLIGAIVTVPGTKIGTNTDIDGYFKLSVPDNAKNLKITYVGYKAVDISPRGQMGEIRMDPDTKMLQDVVVTVCGSHASDPRCPFADLGTRDRGKTRKSGISRGNENDSRRVGHS